MPAQRLEIVFTIDADSADEDVEENARMLKITAHGEKRNKHLQKIQDEGYLDDLIVEYEDDNEE